jgi:hypothetical protein
LRRASWAKSGNASASARIAGRITSRPVSGISNIDEDCLSVRWRNVLPPGADVILNFIMSRPAIGKCLPNAHNLDLNQGRRKRE